VSTHTHTLRVCAACGATADLPAAVHRVDLCITGRSPGYKL